VGQDVWAVGGWLVAGRWMAAESVIRAFNTNV